MRQSLLSTFLCLLLAGCYATTTSSSPPQQAQGIPLATPDQLRDLTPAEKAIVTKGFAAGLKDPDSAKFQWTKIQKSLPMDGPHDYCAMVNAKNSYGGYTGSKPFLGIIQITKGKSRVPV